MELHEYLAPKGRPVPADARSNDRAFQHVAIIVRDMAEAYARLREFKVTHASTGPQKLPAYITAAAGIEAFYFKDPDGHALEVLAFPPDKGAARWQAKDRLFLGIDHTAIVVGDTERSLRFYRDLLGLQVAGESENHGPEQERLNNVSGARLRITGLRAEGGMTVFENVEFPLMIRRMNKAKRAEMVMEALKLIRLAGYAKHYPRQLWGGQQQRVGLARALVYRPKVLLLDEPLSNLDALLRASAREELRQFQRRVGVTTVYVTHDQVEAMGLGDRIVVMNHGKVRQVGTPLDIYQWPADTFVATFVGSPPLNLLEQGEILLGFRPETFLPADAVDLLRLWPWPNCLLFQG